jgi:hypothetical protein
MTSITTDTITNGQVSSQTNCTTNIKTEISADILQPTIAGNNCSSVIGISSPQIVTNELTYVPVTDPTVLEEFIINAINVNQIGNSVNYGMRVSSSQSFQINWGDGVISDYNPGFDVNIYHIYSTPYTGQIKLLSTNLTTITKFDVESSHSNKTLWTSTMELHKLDGLLILNTQNNSLFVTGDVVNLPSSLTGMSCFNNNLSGNSSNMPQLLTICRISGTNTISGDTSGLPTGLIQLTLTGNNTISGDTSGLPRVTSEIFIDGLNTISGNTSGLPEPNYKLDIRGRNTISGDVSNIYPSNIIRVGGDNTISGDVSGFNSPTTLIEIYGQNTISGNISGLPATLTTLIISSIYSIFFGDILNLPSTLTLINLKTLGALTGDMYNLPSLLTEITMVGNLNFTYSSGRVWASNFIRLYLIVNSGSWLGFNSIETDDLINDIEPYYVYNNINSFTIKCSSTPKRTAASEVAFNELKTTIGATNVILN